MRVFTILISVVLAAPACAGPVDDARLQYLDGDYEAALAVLIPAAEAGDANAQNIVADAYDDGNGVAVDHGKALELWTKSANQGFSRARYNLGLMYENGRDGLEPDIEESIKWYVRAAASKNPDAFTNLGFIFETGKRGEPDFDLAQQYYRGGVALGAAQSMANLGMLYVEGTGVTQDYSDALALFQEGALLGNGNAISNLAAMYENGYGVVRDVTAAYALYFEALYLGHPRAALNIAFLLRDEEGFWGSDPVEVMAYCLKAVDLAERPDLIAKFSSDCNGLASGMTTQEKAEAAALAAEL